jgi:hypothetical protein
VAVEGEISVEGAVPWGRAGCRSGLIKHFYCFKKTGEGSGDGHKHGEWWGASANAPPSHTLSSALIVHGLC